MNVSELDFDDLKPVEIPVRIMGKSYVLREASSGAVSQWRNLILRSSRVTAEGNGSGRGIQVQSMEGAADSQPLLVSLCLSERVEIKRRTGDIQVQERPVPIQLVRGWSSRIVDPIYQRILEISNLEGPGKKATTEPVDEATKPAQPDTEESLLAQIDSLQLRLASLADDPPNEPTNGEAHTSLVAEPTQPPSLIERVGNAPGATTGGSV